MSEDKLDPLDYDVEDIDLDNIKSTELPKELVDKLVSKVKDDVASASTVKEVLEVLAEAGKFAIRLGIQAAMLG